jgi:hypothetical protein
MENRVCEKGYRNHPLTDEQKANNIEKSRNRKMNEIKFASELNIKLKKMSSKEMRKI